MQKLDSIEVKKYESTTRHPLSSYIVLNKLCPFFIISYTTICSDVGEGSLQETKSTKHSPIRWSQPPSKEGAKFAGQDEEPDIDYGESEEEANDVPLKMTEKRKDKKRDDANKKSSGSKRGQQRSGRDSREKDYDGRARKYEDDRYRGGESPRRRGGGDDDDRGSGRRKGKDKDYGRSNNKGRNRNARR